MHPGQEQKNPCYSHDFQGKYVHRPPVKSEVTVFFSNDRTDTTNAQTGCVR